MIDIRIADLNIRLHNRYGYTEELCREYVTDAKEIDFEVRVTEDDIAKEIKDSDIPVDEAYAESVCLHREIADRLVLSVRTVDTHVQRILGKLGFGSRAQIAAWFESTRAAVSGEVT